MKGAEGVGVEAAEEDNDGEDTKSNGYPVYQPPEPLPFWGLAGDVQGGTHYVSS